jgi:uncharacterized coiled-coil DUF342 family protein
MNKERRAALDKLQDRIAALKEHVDHITFIHDELDEIRTELQEINDAESEAYNNMPESLQNSERGEASQNSINDMESVDSDLDTLIDAFDGEHFERQMDEIFEALDNAKGAA